MKCFSEIFVIFLQIQSIFSSPDDEIQSLPGLAEKLSFKQYSGYLRAGPEEYLHYWFIESHGNPQKDPLILWLNGGPGCSSLDGLLKENGPFRIGSDAETVTIDKNSWNTLANVLYLESPVGVGFSYTTHNGTFVNSDDSTAILNRLALEDFFKKFPQFKSNPFYITGESYAGIYIPTLAVEIYRNQVRFNLKGLAIGNGFLDSKLLRNSEVKLSLAHGFADAQAYNELVQECCNCSNSSQESCDFFATEECTDKVYKVISFDYDQYNIFNDCDDELQYEKIRRVNMIKYNQKLPELTEKISNDKPFCPFSNFTGYLNRPDVRKALHIPDHVRQWSLCGLGDFIFYHSQYENMRAQVNELIEVHKVPKFIIYNGDLDMACDFLGDQRFVDSLEYKLLKKYQSWKVNGRVGGFVKRYEGITFTTVRGAGHMVPTDQPEAALAIVKELIGINKLGSN